MKLSHKNIENLLNYMALYVRATENYSANSDKLEAKMLAIHTSDLRAIQNSMGVYYARDKELDFWMEQSERGLADV